MTITNQDNICGDGEMSTLVANALTTTTALILMVTMLCTKYSYPFALDSDATAYKKNQHQVQVNEALLHLSWDLVQPL
ncbi:hypothetical protein K493DRAFT_321239 [Basidiobolus meristosporus CBS 931.73]|uniref:Uncharacterized protein n=1 Tax=Basidiobolus meristosporus CBS 931.73 TaxID=1314790 RepID=A0A1Y1WXP7_9FUNG|nr:hypothetical protein K493DRAFT_321239 [Basidiobolus meristosporus CBS 931.73]|eukprot:ORX78320.1 hypothetical protein K493DRAFT_321239 [Basidiobolus meristosporus CBS 931.73]